MIYANRGLRVFFRLCHLGPCLWNRRVLLVPKETFEETFDFMAHTLMFAFATTGPRSLLGSHDADALGLPEYIGIRIGLSQSIYLEILNMMLLVTPSDCRLYRTGPAVSLDSDTVMIVLDRRQLAII